MADLDKMRAKLDKMTDSMAFAVGQQFPIGRRCAILRRRRGIQYRIYGVIWAHPSSWVDPARLAVKTASRGTVLQADYQDIELL